MAEELKVGDIVSRNREPGRKGKVVEIERDRYQSINDVAHVVWDNSPTVAIPVPRYKWDFFTVHAAAKEALAAKTEWIVQGRYPEHGAPDWEDENTELTKEDGLRSLREYRESGPGQYRLISRHAAED